MIALVLCQVDRHLMLLLLFLSIWSIIRLVATDFENHAERRKAEDGERWCRRRGGCGRWRPYRFHWGGNSSSGFASEQFIASCTARPYITPLSYVRFKLFGFCSFASHYQSADVESPRLSLSYENGRAPIVVEDEREEDVTYVKMEELQWKA